MGAKGNKMHYIYKKVEVIKFDIEWAHSCITEHSLIGTFKMTARQHLVIADAPVTEAAFV